MIDFSCPQCKNSYRVEDALAGMKVKCQVCSCKFIAPAPGASEAVAEPGLPGPGVQKRSRLALVLLALGLGLAGAGAFLFLQRPGGSPAAAEEPAPADGILHQWNFDEARDWHDSPFGPLPEAPARIQDLAGHQPASPVGLSAKDWVSGREFMAVQLPGHAWLDAGRDLSPTLGRTASLAFWCRTRQTGGSAGWNSPGITGSAAAKHRGDIQWGWIDGEGHLNFSAGGTILARSSRPIHDDRWHFIVMTRDAATGVGSLYVDGTREDSRPGPQGPMASPFQRIGQIGGSAGDTPCFEGRLDKVTVLNRVMEEAEVKRFMDNHAPKSWDAQTAGSAGEPFMTASVLARAYDAEGDALSVRRWTPPAHGTASHNGDGSFTYTPAPGFAGEDRFEVVVQDGRGGFHLSAMNVTVEQEQTGGGLPTTQFEGLRPLVAGGGEISLPGWRVPRVADLDGDGQPDLLVGAGGGVWFYRNTGTRTAPSFAAGVRLQEGGTDISSGDHISPIALADVTGDRIADLLISDSSGRLRYFSGLAGKGLPVQFAPAVSVRKADGTDFILPDRRFDVGDWNGDGRPDVVTGTGSGDVRLFINSGQAGDPRFGAPEVLFSGSYNLYPRLCDLDGDGQADLARGINWGGVSYWLNVATRRLERGGELALSNPAGAAENLRSTDGAIVDLADLNGDGLPDLVVGGHAGRQLLVALGVRKTMADYLGIIESLYDAHTTDLGAALSAGDNALLGRLNEANRGIANLIQNGSPATRASAFTALAAHLRKYPFLRYQKLDTARFHHVPSIALQNWVFLKYARPDTPAHRREIADLMGLQGTVRDIYLGCALALGDNGTLNEAQLGAIRDFLDRHPRELFPDCLITFDQLFGDQRGGLIWTPDSCKNTFGCDVGNANEWAGDLTEAIEAVQGRRAASGDYFTFVMGHEVTHSLDGYVRSRANQDLARRWGQSLCRAAGPDVVAGPAGWIDWAATRRQFERAGHFRPPGQSWDEAWAAYWKTGPGGKFKDTSFMRGNIDWFMHAPQESLATQANHYWANAPGRLIAAVARFRKGEATGLAPMKANLTEVVDFIDFQSAGMNRVALPKTSVETAPVKRVVWAYYLADLERDDQGRITRITVDGSTYDFDVAADGEITGVRCGNVNKEGPPG